MSDKSDSNKNEAQGAAFGLFILWVIVYSNTTQANFEQLSSGTYYTLAELGTYGNLGIFIGLFVTVWLAAVTMASDNSACGKLTALSGGILVAGMIGIVIYQFVLIGNIMHNDIEHTFFGYSKFWTDGVMNFSNAGPNVNVINTNSSGIITTNRRLNSANNHTTHLRKGNQNYMDDSIYNIEMSRYYRKPLLCDFTNNCDATLMSSYTNSLNRAYNQYWKYYYNDLSQHDLHGKFPTHILAQSKLALYDLWYGSTNTPTIISRRRLIDSVPVTITKHWPYVMADVLVRLSSFGIFLIACILAVGLCCGGSAWTCGKLCGGD